MRARVDPAELQHALQDGSAAGDPDLAALVGIATRLQRLRPASPEEERATALRANFAQTVTGSRPGLFAWFAGWLGLGPRPRGLTTRLASGFLVVALAGGGSAASAPPVREIGVDAARIAENVVVNLNPNRRPSEQVNTPRPESTPPADTASSVSPPAPAVTPAASPSPTTSDTDHHDDDGNDDHKDDSRPKADDSKEEKD